MIPTDAPQQDWNLYYNETYMRHAKLGIVFVRVTTDENDRLMFHAWPVEQGQNGQKGTRVRARDLSIYWPRPGAYNLPDWNTAMYIGRTAQRHMKRSAYRGHYYPIWSVTGVNSNEIIRQMSLARTYYSFDEYKDNQMLVAALSNKVILHRPHLNAPPNLIYMGEDLGVLDGDNLVPYIPDDSRVQRIHQHLKTVGIS